MPPSVLVWMLLIMKVFVSLSKHAGARVGDVLAGSDENSAQTSYTWPTSTTEAQRSFPWGKAQ